ncbi:hypothetical protein [Nocardia altamirensis]|uniref:hypothetical protein n=1 Tax=Nocardia altamirensis TaxID=472158 RepID=UPI000840336C|nr:hypothetical protein [Nocardia altamirensis]
MKHLSRLAVGALVIGAALLPMATAQAEIPLEPATSAEVSAPVASPAPIGSGSSSMSGAGGGKQCWLPEGCM